MTTADSTADATADSSAGTARPAPVPHASGGAFAPFAVPQFLWFWIAAVISNAGTWMQQLAVPIAVHEATGKATWIGITAMSGLVPSLVASTFAGTIADRFERRSVLFVAQGLLALCAFGMWGLFARERPSMILVCALIAVAALIGGVSITTWQSFVPSLVPRELLGPAVRLNSMQFALGRAIGPLLAALAIGHFGARIGFLGNAVSYVTVLLALAFIRVRTKTERSLEPALKQITDGWRYVAAHRSLVFPALTNLVTGAFGFSMVSLGAPIAIERFHRARTASGWLSVGFGCGGIIGMIVASLIGERIRRSKAVPVYLVSWVVGLLALAFAPTFGLGIAAMLVIGIGQVTTGSALNTSLQMQVDDAYRGRAIGVSMWGVQAGVPLGTLALGSVMDHHGARTAILIACAAIGVFTLRAGSLGLRYLDAPGPAGPPLRRRRAGPSAASRGDRARNQT